MKRKNDKAKENPAVVSLNPLSPLSITKITTPIEQTLHLNPGCISTNSKSMDHIVANANLQNTRLYTVLLIVENPN